MTNRQIPDSKTPLYSRILTSSPIPNALNTRSQICRIPLSWRIPSWIRSGEIFNPICSEISRFILSIAKSQPTWCAPICPRYDAVRFRFQFARSSGVIIWYVPCANCERTVLHTKIYWFLGKNESRKYKTSLWLHCYFERIALRNGKYGIPTSNKNHTISAPEQKKINEVNNLSVKSKQFSAGKNVFIVLHLLQKHRRKWNLCRIKHVDQKRHYGQSKEQIEVVEVLEVSNIVIIQLYDLSKPIFLNNPCSK